MMVVFVSQCEKKALGKTRRVLDAFADRIGDNTWQTVITEEGLNAVRKLLRRTASKSTAVSCHWIRTRARSDLLWVVGNRKKFNERGVVPVNYTEGEVEKYMDKEKWQSLEVIKLLAAISGFFHDLGKANNLFQEKIKPNNTMRKSEPFRHEWISLRLFYAFVKDKSDKEWLEMLTKADNNTEMELFDKLKEVQDNLKSPTNKKDFELPPIAKCIAWLIMSHHKLPLYNGDNPPDLKNSEKWFEQNLEPSWNSPQCLSSEWEQIDIEENWSFSNGTPFKSSLWQTRVSYYADKLLKYEQAFSRNWFNQHFTLHLARLCLMLADHYYSSGYKTNTQEQDRNYKAYANTYENKYKQKLDEHNIEVGKNAYKIAEILPKLLNELPILQQKEELTKKVPKELKNDFGWQDESYKLAKTLRDEVKQNGFFGINMASTGKGKTRCNIRIMAGISENIRLSIALGLRTLTLQTGDALKADLGLNSDEVAVLIGSSEIKELHEKNKISEKQEIDSGGSLSSESLLDEQLSLYESLPDYSGIAQKWIEHDPKIIKLIQAPILVSTIDYLMPATEGVRGGRQIAPMLRLLSSDLILDEPDDFGLEDLPALCRLVNWAGMLGGRVLLSTATLSPSLAKALFQAYQEGRKHYIQANSAEASNDICCAWFDEFSNQKLINAQDFSIFKKEHEKFIAKRISKLKENKRLLHKGKIIPVTKELGKTPSKVYSEYILTSLKELHSKHFVTVDEKKVSFGLVRFANIDPLVQITKCLISQKAPENTIIHYCIYHSQFPLLQRSCIENQLDKYLNRKKEDEWLKNTDLVSYLKQFKQENHVFVVLATAVAEVGRDHDYDWAIIEPSSMRSIIQIAGRVQRHRKQKPKTENIYILSKNFKGLKGKIPSFEKPGFESKELRYNSRDIEELITDLEDIKEIDAIARIKSPVGIKSMIKKDNGFSSITSFELLESLAQELKLQGNKNNLGASAWWEHSVSWTACLQNLQQFRKSRPQDNYRLTKTRRDEFIWQTKEKNSLQNYENTSNIEDELECENLGEGVVFWETFNLDKEVEKLAQLYHQDELEILHRFTYVLLDVPYENNVEQYFYNPHLGIYRKLKNERYENE